MNPKSLFNIIILIFLSASPVQPQKVLTEAISKGIRYKNITNTVDTLIIHILSINTDSCNCSIGTVKANNSLNSLERTSIIANDSDVIAAVNADFFKTDGSVINNLISNHYIIKAVSEPVYNSGNLIYSQFAIDNNMNPYIEQFRFSGIIKSELHESDIFGINVPFSFGKNILYNNFADIPDSISSMYLLQFIDYSSSYPRYISSGLLKEIPSLGVNDYLYLTDDRLNANDTVTLILKFKPDYGNLKELTGGWPALVKNGINISGESEVLEGTSSRFSSARHPRTGVGFSSDSTTIYFFVVDGRQKGSRGISLNEFSEIMISEGAAYGLNLDGGGSSTMLINGRVVNNPSDSSGERRVGNILAVKKKGLK